MGLRGDELAKAVACLPSNSFEAYPETVDALNAFSVVATQWRMRVVPVGMGASQSVPSGLDYTACAAIFAARNIDVAPEVWGDLQTIESAILDGSRSW